MVSSCVVSVKVEGAEEFRLVSGDNRHEVPSIGCGRVTNTIVLSALRDAVRFCEINESRFNDRNGVLDGGCSSSQVERDVPVAVPGDNEAGG